MTAATKLPTPTQATKALNSAIWTAMRESLENGSKPVAIEHEILKGWTTRAKRHNVTVRSFRALICNPAGEVVFNGMSGEVQEWASWRVQEARGTLVR